MLELRESAATIEVSAVAYAETFAALNRKRREGTLDDETFSRVAGDFNRDWESFNRIEVTDPLNTFIEQIAAKHPLRGFDLIHLASALMLQSCLAEPILFATADRRLLDAARKENLQTFPPSDIIGEGKTKE